MIAVYPVPCAAKPRPCETVAPNIMMNGAPGTRECVSREDRILLYGTVHGIFTAVPDTTHQVKGTNHGYIHTLRISSLSAETPPTNATNNNRRCLQFATVCRYTVVVVVVVVVVVGVTLNHRHNAVHGHRIGSNNSGVEDYLRSKKKRKIIHTNSTS